MKNPIRKGFAEVNDAKIYYQTIEKGNGFPLVMIHGLAVDSRIWQNQFEFFSTHFCPLVYDVRGFGQSSPTSPHIAADDLKALLDYLQIDKAHIMGSSMGGNIAVNFAEAYPECVAKLVVVDADVYGFDNYTNEFKALFKEIYAIGAKEGALKAKLHWARNPLLQPKNITEDTKKIEMMIRAYSGVHFTDPHLLPGANPPTASRLHEIQAETLVIVGEYDIEDFQRMADLLTNKIPYARKVVITNCGHLPNLEQANEFNTLVENFLRN